jgi:membrane protein YdbS with pleckstrin-like domain
MVLWYHIDDRRIPKKDVRNRQGLWTIRVFILFFELNALKIHNGWIYSKIWMNWNWWTFGIIHLFIFIYLFITNSVHN